MKQQGLQLEDSQVDSAERLIKLTASAASAACIIMQLVQARDGRSSQAAQIAFSDGEIDALEALLPELEGATEAQKNPHRPHSLAWASWIIAKLAAGTAMPRPDLRDPSPSNTASTTSEPSPQAGVRHLCESPSLYTGTRPGVLGRLVWSESDSAAWVDLERGWIFRRGKAEADIPTKRRPLVRLPKRLLNHMRRWRRLHQEANQRRARSGLRETAHVLHHGGRPIGGKIRRSCASAVTDAAVPAANRLPETCQEPSPSGWNLSSHAPVSWNGNEPCPR
jgi:hypothetical protein